MKIKPITKSIKIHASKERVWEVLTADKFTRQWYSAFSEGSHAETDWQVGSKAIFTDNSETGIWGTIVENIPAKSIIVEYQGVITGGKDDPESPYAKEVKGSRESYHIHDHGDHCQLDINAEMSEEYYDMMADAWDNALKIFKELAERK